MATELHRLHRAFTAIELLVVIVIVVILLSIFVPYALHVRETGRRARCRDNLRQIFQALQMYAAANGHFLPRVVHDPNFAGYTAFTGADDPNPFAPNSAVRPNDVTASLWLLVRGGYLVDPRVFVCPSTDDEPESAVGARQRSNFHSPRNLSYSYASPFSPVPSYRLTDTMVNDFVIIADANPGGASGNARPPVRSSQSAMAKINSLNHGRAGQNVVYAYSAVQFQWNPYCATDNDDIYTAQLAPMSPSATTRAATTSPATVPARAQGQLGPHAFPVSPTDSFLVPAADDMFPSAPLTPATSPATAPATAPLATTAVAPAPSPTTTTATPPTTTATPTRPPTSAPSTAAAPAATHPSTRP